MDKNNRNRRSLEEKLKEIMADIFSIPEDEIADESSPETIEAWDSVQHLNLILAMEEEFNINLSADEVTEMTSVGVIKKLLEGKRFV